MRRTLLFFNDISGADRPARQDLAEDPPDGHDAVAGEMEDGALGVAFLTGLADPHPDRVSDDKLVADAESAEVDSPRGQVFGESPRSERDGGPGRETGSLLLDVFDHQEGNLPMGEAPMGVVLDALAGHEFGGRDGGLDLPFLAARVEA